jgi:hypothetical protein
VMAEIEPQLSHLLLHLHDLETVAGGRVAVNPRGILNRNTSASCPQSCVFGETGFEATLFQLSVQNRGAPTSGLGRSFDTSSAHTTGN